MARKANPHWEWKIFLEGSHAELHSILIDNILDIFSIRNIKMNTNTIS